MQVRRLIGAALAVVGMLVVTACGGSSSSSGGSGGASNGVAAKTPNQIVAAATKAIDGASSVKVTGSVRQSASASISLDLSVASGKGATGTVAENGLSLQLISTGTTAYVKGSSAFLKQFGGAPAVKLFAGHWIKSSASSGAFASFASLTNLHALVAGLLSHHGALTKGAQSTIDGTPVIAVEDRSKGGTLYVATHGTPYPIRIANTKSAGGGQISFGSFGAPVTITAPADAIDLDKMK